MAGVEENVVCGKWNVLYEGARRLIVYADDGSFDDVVPVPCSLV